MLSVLDSPCGHPDCHESATFSKVYKRSRKEQIKAWCSNHKWCSKCFKYEMAGSCAKLMKSNNDVSISRFFSTSWTQLLRDGPLPVTSVFIVNDYLLYNLLPYFRRLKSTTEHPTLSRLELFLKKPLLINLEVFLLRKKR